MSTQNTGGPAFPQQDDASESEGSKMNVIKTKWQDIKRPHQDVDVATLAITDDPYTGRKYREGKYDSIFGKLKYGQSIRCNSEDTAKLSNAMRDWAKRMGKKGVIKGVAYYTKTTGRVFWLKEEPTK